MNDELEVTDELDEGEAPEVDQTEEEARAQGWVPESEYKGKPGTHKSAEEFLEFGERLNPILKKQRDDYKRELDSVKGEVEFLKNSTKELLEFRTKRLTEEHDAQVNYLKSELKKARREQDHDVADVLEEQLETLNKEKPVVTAPVNDAQEQYRQKIQRELKEFLDTPDNEWHVLAPGGGEKNKKMSRYADQVALEVRKEHPRMEGKAFFQEVFDRVKADFPEEFKATTRRSSPVESGERSSPRAVKSGTYDSMPRDARAMCDRFVKDGTVKSKDEYAKVYWSQKGV